MQKIVYQNTIYVFLTVFLLILTGCVTTQTIYLGDIEVDAPVITPPIHAHINKEVGKFTISPRISMLTSGAPIKSETEDRYEGILRLNDTITYRSNAENLIWNIPKYIVGADLDVKLAEVFSIFCGFNYSFDDQSEMSGGNLGISFHNHMESPSFRFDLGITIQKYNFTAITMVHTKTESIFGDDEFWYVYSDKGSSTNINPFISLTIYSSASDEIVNWFLPVGFFTQNLLGFKPGTYTYVNPLFPFFVSGTIIDKRSDMVAKFFYTNPGLSFKINSSINLLLSTKIIKELSDADVSIMPSLQFDFQL